MDLALSTKHTTLIFIVNLMEVRVVLDSWGSKYSFKLSYGEVSNITLIKCFQKSFMEKLQTLEYGDFMQIFMSSLLSLNV